MSKVHLLLSAFQPGVPVMRLTELSRRSGVSKASAYRLAQELVDGGLLERTTAGYQLGWRVFELSELIPAVSTLRRLARPALLDLFAATGATIYLAVDHGNSTAYLEQLAGRRHLGLPAPAGARLPIHCTASGKLLLALGPARSQRLDALELSPLEHRTPHTIRSVADLRSQLETIRERRYATEAQETVLGYRAVAAPVCDGAPDNVVAAISLITPVARHDHQPMLRSLLQCAADVSRSISASTAASHAHRA